MIEDGASAVRETMVDQYREYEKLLDPDQEAIATFILPSREIRMRVAQIGSTATGLLNIFGEYEDGRPVDIFIYYTQLCYFVEAVSTEKPRRIGFGRSEA